MRKLPLIWLIFPPYLLVIVAAVVAVMTHTSRSIESFYRKRIEDDLWVRAQLMSEKVQETLENGDYPKVHALCRRLGEPTGTRITVVLPDGRVVGDSAESPDSMSSHLDRPEIVQAAETGTGSLVRFSDTLQRDMMYAAKRIDAGERILGFLRVAVPVTQIHEALHAVNTRLLYTGAVVVLAAAAVSLIVSRRISRPLAEMRRGAVRFAKGDFSEQLPPPKSQEMASLADAMNRMAEDLDSRIRTISNERNQQEAVLSSMVEGVLAVDTHEHIISFNKAAGSLLGVDLSQAQHQPLSTIAQDTPLHQFVQQVLESGETTEGEFVTHERESRILQAHGAALRDGRGHKIGAVVVLNDVTRLRRLEQVRRDFVANVSHELRTPITSIKGFVETLLDGALDSAEDARRFLHIVAKQADRLNAILNDLLLLSRVEEGEEKATISLERGPLRETLAASILLCEARAKQKHIQIDLKCAPDLHARMNPSLIEQAVANLVDNAIKYSEIGGSITVRADTCDGDIVIEVADHGCGIPEEHLPRLFERFYRVDKARSRSLGGTGLGLAIVKHITRAHGGRVAVASVPGQGTTFSIHLPNS